MHDERLRVLLCSPRQAPVVARVCGGADGWRQSDVGRWTALVWAARFGHEREVKLLIGAKANVEAKDTGGYGRGPTSVQWQAVRAHRLCRAVCAAAPRR